MSLIVSLRIPDGVVMAADSLATVNATPMINVEGPFTCEKCSHQQIVKLEKIAAPALALGTFSFAQKLFAFGGTYGIAASGLSAVNQRTIYTHVQELVQRQQVEPYSVSKLADVVAEYMHGQLKAQFGDDLEQKASSRPLSFHIGGCELVDGSRRIRTVSLDIGAETVKQEWDEIGCTISGDQRVVKKLWELQREDPRQSAAYGNFSLQDAIDYAEFLIRTTADYQRFSNLLPSVGGDIDIALVGPYVGFKWIRRKKLMELIDYDHN